ncbi:MAG: hypothetical protein AAF721_24365 [Myxococcota bacterium]
MTRSSAIALVGLLCACGSDPRDTDDRFAECVGGFGSLAVTNYHGGPDKLGAQSQETELRPDAVLRRGLGVAWESPPLHAETIDGVRYAPHLYASPLYVDQLPITAGRYAGAELSTVIAASSNGWVYAINASVVSRISPLVT